MRLIVVITGASGVAYGRRLLEVLREKKVETHLVVSRAAERVIEHQSREIKRDLGMLAIKETVHAVRISEAIKRRGQRAGLVS